MTDWFLPAGGPGSPDEWCFQTVTTADIKIYADYQSYYDRLAGLRGLEQQVLADDLARRLAGLRYDTWKPNKEKSATWGSSVVSIVIEKMSFKMVWLMSSMFAPHSASTTATAATMPLSSASFAAGACVFCLLGIQGFHGPPSMSVYQELLQVW